MPSWHIGQIGVVPSLWSKSMPQNYDGVTTTRSPFNAFHPKRAKPVCGTTRSVESNFIGTATEHQGATVFRFKLIRVRAPKLRRPIK
jgi:hypothetical protein